MTLPAIQSQSRDPAQLRLVDEAQQEPAHLLGLRAVAQREVTVVSGQPPDDDEVGDDVQPFTWPPAVGSEVDVVQGGVFHPLATDPTTPVVALDHGRTDGGGDVAILAILLEIAAQRKRRRR